MRELYLIDLEQDGLHNQLARGFAKGSLCILIGDDGSGKSALTQRFAYSFLKHNYTVTIVSTELTTQGFINQMRSLGYPILEYLLEKKILFVPVFPLIGKPIPRKDFLTRLMSARELFETEITIIDTFSSLVKEEISPENALQVIGMFKKLTAKSKTIMITIDPKDLSEATLAPFKSAADVYLVLTMRLIGGKIERTITVNRFLGARSHIGENIGFRIEAGAGLIVDITTVA